MIKVLDVKEAVIIRDALTMMLIAIEGDKTLQKDKKLYDSTWLAINTLRIKYHKIALTQMRADENGQWQFKDAN